MLNNDLNIRSRVALFDVDAIDIDRFFVEPLSIKKSPDLIIIENYSEYEKYRSTGIFYSGNIVCSSLLSVNRLSKLLSNHNIEILFINAHRIVDVHIILAARLAGCKVVYIQHGMYVRFMKRSTGFFVKKLFKTCRYLFYAADASKSIGDIRLLFSLFGIHVLGLDRQILSRYRQIFPDLSMVFSEYWKGWHIDNYAFPHDMPYLTIGSPDFRKFKFSDMNCNGVVIYCYQTLIEDGRIDKKDMYKFYLELHNFCNLHGFKCLIKSHPRGDSHNLNYLEHVLGFSILEGVLINPEYVIGHYSSLLAFWGIRGCKILCVKLPGHDIDSSISPWVNVYNSLDDVDFAKVVPANRSKCENYYGPCKDETELLKNMFEFIEK